MPLADDPFEDVAVALELDHRSGRLVDEPLDLGLHPSGRSTVWEHLSIEPQSAQFPVLVERLRDLIGRTDFDCRSERDAGRPSFRRRF